MINKVNLVSNTTFKGTDPFAGFAKPQMNSYTDMPTKDQVTISNKEKKSFFDKIHDIKEGFINVITTFNGAAITGKGVAKGVTQGIGASILTGVVVKNIAASKEGKLINIGKMLGGTIGDTVNGLINSGKYILSVPNKMVKTIAKDALNLVPKFFGKAAKKGVEGAVASGYLKGNKLFGLIAIGAGLLVAGINIVKARFDANQSNAEIRHGANVRQA